MDEEFKQKIEEIVGGMQCPRGFRCYRNNFANVCMAEDIGMDSFLVCLEEEPKKCIFVLPFGEGYFCKCPLRVYIAKSLKK